MTYEAFSKDDRTIDAVIRNFAVLGEAARHVPDEVRTRFSDVPWLEMSDMRDIMIHEYFGVDHRLLWTTIQSDLPPLLPALRQMLDEA